MADYSLKSAVNAATSAAATFQGLQAMDIDDAQSLDMDDILALKVAVRQMQALVNSTDGAASTASLAVSGIVSSTAGAAAEAVFLRSGKTATEGWELRTIDEDVSIASAVASKDLTQDVPTNSVILSVQANLDTTITAATAVKVGIGVAADPDKYGLSADLVLDTKIDTLPDYAVLSSAEDILVYACDTNGAAAGTIGAAGNIVRVKIVFLALNSLDDV